MVSAETLGITTRAVKKSIKELSENGILERVGSARGGYWQVKNWKGCKNGYIMINKYMQTKLGDVQVYILI